MPLNRWQQGDGPICSGGKLACSAARLLCGSISKFHTERLEDATRDINAILEEVAEHDKDRPPRADLSILETPDGLFLSWTQSSGEGVAIDDEDEIKKFLGTYNCPPDNNSTGTPD
jgi:hypothetical protein